MLEKYHLFNVTSFNFTEIEQYIEDKYINRIIISSVWITPGEFSFKRFCRRTLSRTSVDYF